MLLINLWHGFNLAALSCALIANLGISISAPESCP